MEWLALEVVGAILAMVLIMLAIPKVFGRAARLRRRLHASKQCAIRELADAPLVPRRIAGMVVAIDQPLIAPLSGRPCVFYETRAVRHIAIGPTSDIDYEVASETRSVPFFIEDGTGTALVDAKHAETLLGIDIDRWAGDTAQEGPAEDAFLARFGQRRRGLLFKKRLHLTESIIETGERIAVMGTALPEPDPSASSADPYRHHATPKQPRLTRSARCSLVITDDQKFAPPLDDE